MGDTRKSNDGPIHRYILTAAAAATVTLFLVSARQNNHTCLETTTTTRPPGGAGPMNDSNYDDAAEACVRWADSSRYPDPVNTDWLWLWGGRPCRPPASSSTTLRGFRMTRSIESQIAEGGQRG